MLVHADGELDAAWGGKVYLVPFTEALPFRGLIGPLIGDRGGEWGWVTGSFTPARESALLPLDGARVGVLVCYEQLFPDLSRSLRNRGADFQVIITNDAWFGRSVFQQYQADAPRLRAIENRTEFLRVANTGVSGRIDRHGRYHERSALFEEEIQVHELQLAAGPTVYDRLGDVTVWLVVAGLVWSVVLALRKGVR
jgi:apolipoprotein N-acyltransferase